MEAFETWCCIRTLKSLWTTEVRNVVVYVKMNKTNEINVQKNFRKKKMDRIYNEEQRDNRWENRGKLEEID